MIVIITTIQDRGDGGCTVRTDGTDVGNASDLEVENADIVAFAISEAFDNIADKQGEKRVTATIMRRKPPQPVKPNEPEPAPTPSPTDDPVAP